MPNKKELFEVKGKVISRLYADKHGDLIVEFEDGEYVVTWINGDGYTMVELNDRSHNVIESIEI